MTLPDEVVKEIEETTQMRRYADLVSRDFGRLCLLTRRLTIEECAKVCEARAKQWADGKPPHEQSVMQSNKVTEGLYAADSIRQLEGK